jgi:holo-[acyl-carrier protein] synthase
VIISSGIDIIEVERVRHAVEKWGQNFLQRIFTDDEIGYARKRRFSSEHLAARFATKEAVSKAFGSDRWIDWKNIEIVNARSGKPGVKLSGYLEEMRRARGIDEIVVSMSHTKSYAVANAILMKRG